MKTAKKLALKRGFTLIELLVVIMIIAALATMAYGPIMKAIANAKRESARKVASDLVFAVEQFYKGYDYLPFGDGEGSAPDSDTRYDTDNGDLLVVLMGQEDVINSKGTKFFAADTAKSGVNGVVYTGDSDTPEALVDPFGNPYAIVIDYDLDDKINVTADLDSVYTDTDGDVIVRSHSAVVATPGPDKEWNDKDDVKTW